MSDKNTRPPRDSIIRALKPGVEFRSSADVGDLEDGLLGVVDIRFSPVNEWTTIRSHYEGTFMERFAPGAWKKTIRERMTQIRSLFQHGMDPQIGDKPLGPIRTLVEDEDGGFAQVGLLDTSYNRDLIPGLKANLYGASHRFKSVRVSDEQFPARSDHNPEGILERTIKEAQLYELGPVTFPAYAGATAGMRSMTDDFLIRCFEQDTGRLRDLFETYEQRGIELDADASVDAEQADDERHDQQQEQDQQDQQVAPSEDDAETTDIDGSHLADERRETDANPKPGSRTPIYGQRRKETSKPWLLGPSKSTKRS